MIVETTDFAGQKNTVHYFDGYDSVEECLSTLTNRLGDIAIVSKSDGGVTVVYKEPTHTVSCEITL